MISRILVGVDGSAGSRRALRWAVEEAAAHGGAVQAVTVWQTLYEAGAVPYQSTRASSPSRRGND